MTCRRLLGEFVAEAMFEWGTPRFAAQAVSHRVVSATAKDLLPVTAGQTGQGEP